MLVETHATMCCSLRAGARCAKMWVRGVPFRGVHTSKCGRDTLFGQRTDERGLELTLCGIVRRRLERHAQAR